MTTDRLKVGLRRVVAITTARRLAEHDIDTFIAGRCLRELVEGPHGAVWAEAIADHQGDQA